MIYVIVFGVGIPLFALVFSALVMFFGLFWMRFQTTGTGGFKGLYLKMLIISTIYLGTAMLGIGGLLGLGIMALGYRFVFDADWVEAFVLGLVGGIIGWGLLIVFLAGLVQMGILSLPT